jgi:single-strand DNA-binding protein
MNTIMITGNMAHNPEVRFTKTGKAVASFSVAVNRYNGQSDSVDFIPVVAWERLGEACGNSLTKGQRVFVQGRLQIRSYDGNDGQKKWVSEIVAELVSPNLEQAASRQPAEGAVKPAAEVNKEVMGTGHQDISEEIPF